MLRCPLLMSRTTVHFKTKTKNKDKYNDKDKDKYKDKDKDIAYRIIDTLLVCYIFGILMT